MNDLLFESYEPSFEALSIIYDSTESEYDTLKTLIQTGYLVDSGASNDIIMEGVSDVFQSIVSGIRKFIEKVKEFFKKILAYITTAYQDLDKVADKVKPLMSGKTVKYTINGFNFTVMGKNGPDVSEFRKLVDNYNSDMEELQKLKKAELNKDIIEWLSDDNLDALRGKVLGTNTRIDEDDFMDEIKKYYRDGELSPIEIEVTNSMVDEIISHAKKLEETKRSSIKDRDNLLSLLEKTEKFFSRNIYTYYKGQDKVMNVNKLEVNDDNTKLTKTDNEVVTSTTTSEIISLYASYKSKQVNRIASMINSVASERVIALRDQIKQERTILRKCLFSSESDLDDSKTVSEAIDVFLDAGMFNGSDYQTHVIESNIPICKMYNDLSRIVLMEEAKFILNSVNDGEVYYLMEAGTSQLGTKIKNTILDMIEKLSKMFRKKAMENVDKYKPWLDEIKDGLKEKGKDKKEISVANFIGAEYEKIARDIQTAVGNAYKSTDYTSASFATPILSTIKTIEDLKDANNRTLMLNYFRTGKESDKLTYTTISGQELASKLDSIINYIETYDKAVVKVVDNIKTAMSNSIESFKVTESMITGSTYLDIISSPVCESDIVLCRDYNRIFNPVSISKSIMEADIGGDGKAAISGENNGNKEANKSVKDSAKAASEETKEGEEVKSATSVQSVDKEGIEEKKTNNEAVTYKKAVDKFFEYALSLYMKAREEQFIAYVNILSEIDGSKPKFDKNGEYISKKEEAEEKASEEKEVTKAESK